MSYPQVPQQLSDPISENLAKLAELFPAAVKDGALDVEALRAELGDFEEIKPGDETYELNWVGKQAAMKEAFKPLLGKTLALKDDGKNSATTQHLFIEGDNLEALKILRQNYYGEVKMIYIDPPYNTGNDFVYTDKFNVSSGESEEEEGALNAEGKRLIKNEKTSNKFHARWLDMIYPRLRIAKDLLRENGVIFISIGDDELGTLRLTCGHIFGEDNFIGTISRVMKSGGAKGRFFTPNTDYVLCYAKNISFAEPFRLGISASQITTYYKFIESTGPRTGERYGEERLYKASLDPRPNQRYWIKCPDGSFVIPPGVNMPSVIAEGEKIRPTAEDGVWKWTYETYFDHLTRGNIVFKKTTRSSLVDESGKTSIWNIYNKLWLREQQEKGKVPGTFLADIENRLSAAELENLNIPFDFAKPTKLIRYLLTLSGASNNDLVLDFFSGSATTAHAVMQHNVDESGQLRFIMVQLSEKCAVDSEAAKTGFENIAEISKERIRRAGEKIKEDLKEKQAEWKKQLALDSKKGSKLELDDEDSEQINPYIIDPNSLDIGFKSFRIEDTKINWLKKDLRGEQLEFDDTTTQDALDFVPGYTDTDVVYELMLRQSNIPLTGTITKPITTAKRTYLYADAYLICLEEKITQKLVESLASLEPTPNKYFFRDSAFGTDIALKDETFRRLKAEIHKHHGDLGAAYTVEFI